jgi:hypothetical protein
MPNLPTRSEETTRTHTRDEVPLLPNQQPENLETTRPHTPTTFCSTNGGSTNTKKDMEQDKEVAQHTIPEGMGRNPSMKAGRETGSREVAQHTVPEGMGRNPSTKTKRGTGSREKGLCSKKAAGLPASMGHIYT